MSDELLINVTPMECRVALIQNGTVNELFVETYIDAPPEKVWDIMTGRIRPDAIAPLVMPEHYRNDSCQRLQTGA